MLRYFLLPLTDIVSGFNIFSYISFRAAGAAITSGLFCFIFGPAILRRLQSMQIHQVVRAGTPDSHAGKGTTPTMGGFIILAAIAGSTLLWMRLDSKYVWLALIVTLLMGLIGFLDDFLKLKQKREGRENRGLVERYKLAGQVSIGLLLGLLSLAVAAQYAAGRLHHAAVLQVRADHPDPALALPAVRDLRDDGHEQRSEPDRRP
jgi:UDP-N-acetylmuramyl pentapeptide phosphotransferase/UDP-N-acetylglucosamine-1-phosphate transferase